MRTEAEYNTIATSVFNETRGTKLVEDDISLCAYVSDEMGIELTLDESTMVRGLMDKIEEQERDGHRQ